MNVERYTKRYGRAYRAALAIIQEEEADIRIAKDKANACGAIAATSVERGWSINDLKNPDEPAMVAAFKAAK